MKNLVPTFGGLESTDACSGVVAGRVYDGVLSEDSYTPRVARGTRNSVFGATVSGLACDSRTLDVRAKAGLVSSVEGAGGVGGNSLPSGV